MQIITGFKRWGSNNDRINSKSKLPPMEKAEDDAYNIQLIQWNGSQFELSGWCKYILF